MPILSSLLQCAAGGGFAKSATEYLYIQGIDALWRVSSRVGMRLGEPIIENCSPDTKITWLPPLPFKLKTQITLSSNVPFNNPLRSTSAVYTSSFVRLNKKGNYHDATVPKYQLGVELLYLHRFRNSHLNNPLSKLGTRSTNSTLRFLRYQHSSAFIPGG